MRALSSLFCLSNTSMHAYTHTHMHECTHVHTHAHTHAHTCMHACTDVLTIFCVYKHHYWAQLLHIIICINGSEKLGKHDCRDLLRYKKIKPLSHNPMLSASKYVNICTGLEATAHIGSEAILLSSSLSTCVGSFKDSLIMQIMTWKYIH